MFSGHILVQTVILIIPCLRVRVTSMVRVTIRDRVRIQSQNPNVFFRMGFIALARSYGCESFFRVFVCVVSQNPNAEPYLNLLP